MGSETVPIAAVGLPRGELRSSALVVAATLSHAVQGRVPVGPVDRPSQPDFGRLWAHLPL